MDKEKLNFTMAQSMMVSGSWDRQMEKEFFHTLQEKFMTETGFLAKLTDMVSLDTKVAQFTKGNGSQISNTAKGMKSGPMEAATKETIFKE